VMVTHNPEWTDKISKVVRMRDGRLIESQQRDVLMR
jgi:ABC-type lipoprotein export system ATPase subunit